MYLLCNIWLHLLRCTATHAVVHGVACAVNYFIYGTAREQVYSMHW